MQMHSQNFWIIVCPQNVQCPVLAPAHTEARNWTVVLAKSSQNVALDKVDIRCIL